MEFLFEFLFITLLEGFVRMLWWIVVLPVAYIVATPVIFMHAVFSRQGFRETLSDDYEWLFSFWRHQPPKRPWPPRPPFRFRGSVEAVELERPDQSKQRE